MRALHTFCLASALVVGAGLNAARADPVKAAVLDFELVDSSQEGEIYGVREDQTRRLARSQQIVVEALKNASVEVVDATPAKDELKLIAKVHECLRCAQKAAASLGADYAVIGHIQKVSNLILNINVQIVDAKTGRTVRGGSADIRGNTDETWEHGTKYLMKRNVLKEPLPAGGAG